MFSNKNGLHSDSFQSSKDHGHSRLLFTQGTWGGSPPVWGLLTPRQDPHRHSDGICYGFFPSPFFDSGFSFSPFTSMEEAFM